MAWIPASAGMTNSGPLVIQSPYVLPMLALPLKVNRFWTRMKTIVDLFVSLSGLHYDGDPTKRLLRHQLYENLLRPVIAYFKKYILYQVPSFFG
jgi:hypothetical protein